VSLNLVIEVTAGGWQDMSAEVTVTLSICTLCLLHLYLFPGKFINNNSVTRQVNSSSKSPELLARYCDLLLKKSSKNPEEAELEDTLNQVVSGELDLIV